jgi:hypothetical protein
MRRENLADELAGGLMFGLAGGLMFGLTFGLAGGLVGGLAVVLAHRLLGVINDLAAAGTAVVGADPPRRFAHARPDAVLTASRRSGLVGGLLGGLAGGLIFGLLGGLAGGLAGGPAGGLAGGLAVGPIAGLAFGLRGGLDAWLYHYFLRGRLRARGVLPVRLPEFLEWCADDERGWLRITDAYEFRHREFLDHLALTTGGVQQAAILQDGVMVPSAP